MKIFTLIISSLVFCNIALAQETPTQQLPISYTFTSNNQVIKLESAKTYKEKEIGLMGRTHMDDNHGMIFIYNSVGLRSFWMKNTLISLDMIFLKNNKIIDIIENVPPCISFPSCPSYGPDQVANQVIELNAGKAKQLKLDKGQSITLYPFTDGNDDL
jgi:uncharacterized protein